MTKRIPNTHPHLVIIRPPRIPFIDQIHSVQKVDGKQERWRKLLESKLEPGTRLHKVRPVLRLQISRHVQIPQNLGMESLKLRLQAPERVTGPALDIQNQIIRKLADVDPIGIVLRELSMRSISQQVPKTLAIRNPAAVIRNRPALIG